MNRAFGGMVSITLGLTLLAAPAHSQVLDRTSGRLLDRLTNSKLTRELKKSQSAAFASTIFHDTTWVGHSEGLPNSGPPWCIGTGPARVGVNSDGSWGWDEIEAPCGDSLMGWLPIRRVYTLTAGRILSDRDRPQWALDHGNQANYSPNRGPSQARTFGVVGIWHSDAGSAEGALTTWSPISGGRSAWCGLRAHGDVSNVDALSRGGTGSPFNQTVLEYNGENPSTQGHTHKRFPGYGSQWDQMLYRDIALADGASLEVAFLYRTRMSKQRDLSPATRTGWFDKDPTSLATGNLISSTDAGASCPADSFMVYVGVPADPTSSRRANGLDLPVTDLKRRWFSEVIDIATPGTTYQELLSVAGDQPPGPVPSSATASFTLPNSAIQPMLNAQAGAGGRVRLVFRVKSNRGFDDGDGSLTGYSSETAGAALLDDVVVNGITLGNFEDPASIHNVPEPEGAALTTWKSTGRPPAVHYHAHPLEGGLVGAGNPYGELEYNDECGSPGSPNRLCNLGGVVISAGDHDDLERLGGSFGTADAQRMEGIISPAINLGTSGPANAMGITEEIRDATDDFYIRYEVYTGVFDLHTTGTAWTVGFQSYPARQTNGVDCWGELCLPSFQMFNPRRQCFQDLVGGFVNRLIRTSNEDGIPDSIRIFIGSTQQCFRFGLTLGCSPTSGGYFDNVSLGFADLGEESATGNTPYLRAIGVLPERWIADAFPFSRGLEGIAAFDTTTALLLTSVDLSTHASGPAPTPSLGDSMVVEAMGPSVRMDLVFRVRPGPGNFVTIGAPASGLRQVPTSTTAAVAGDGSFWGTYLADHDGGSGFGTPQGHDGNTWRVDVWNVARCDTAELRLFPVSAAGNLPGLQPGVWSATYHEQDPRYATLGVSRARCFLVDTLGAVAATNLTCGAAPIWLTTLPPSRTGWDGSLHTLEGTKILPDGQLTPGSVVQYFFRRSSPPESGVTAMAPDTSLIVPQRCQGVTFDPVRIQLFSVLPDRWKDPAFGGLGRACLLYANLAPGRGEDGPFWQTAGALAMADTSGDPSSTSGYWNVGAHVNVALAFGDLLDISNYTYHRADFNAFAKGVVVVPNFGSLGLGATFDVTHDRFYGLRTDVSAGVSARINLGREAFRESYQVIQATVADATRGFPEGLPEALAEYMQESSPSLKKAFLGFGAFAEALQGLGTSGLNFLEFDASVSLRSPDYRLISGSTLRFPDLERLSTLLTPAERLRVSASADCGDVSNVLEVRPTVPGTQAVAWYQDGGFQGPYVAAVHAPEGSGRYFSTLIHGFAIQSVFSRFGDGPFGAIPFFYETYAGTFGSLCALTGTPAVTLDSPQTLVAPVSSLSLAGPNPTRGRASATLRLILDRAERVDVTVVDVAGRIVRPLVRGQRFPTGTHELEWDGADRSGRIARPGVYFARARWLESGRSEVLRLTILR